MSLNVPVLRASFALVAERQPQVTRRFYEVLFERYPPGAPAVRRTSMPAQEKMLTEALVAVLDRIEDGAWLTETLKRMGAKHEGYGVTSEMYEWVGASLLATLAEWPAKIGRARRHRPGPTRRTCRRFADAGGGEGSFCPPLTGS